MNKTLLTNPIIRSLAEGREIVWLNPERVPAAEGVSRSGFRAEEVVDAESRLARFAPYLARVFPETGSAGGLVESELRPISVMAGAMAGHWHVPDRSLDAPCLLKMDSHLPVSGSVKARGAFYEVIAVAERLALASGLLDPAQDYAQLAEPEWRDFFGEYELAVGSTGNLGLSVGLMGSALGFRTTVHMSADARGWKKDLLRRRGVRVIEYEGDYGAAVAAGRKTAENSPRCHFVDDEQSRDLFLGYAVAGLRLVPQLRALDIYPTARSPMMVYIPCGVGGGPGGITLGLKLVFGDAVRCFFVEPVQAPAMALGLISGLDERVCAADIGLSGKTRLDGLAVSRPSGLACRAMRPLLDGLCTVRDEAVFPWLAMLEETEQIRLEPSALAGFAALLHQWTQRLSGQGPDICCHIIWATGGNLVPPTEWLEYANDGRRLLR